MVRLMEKYLLDTCVCISMFRNEGRVREMLLEVGTIHHGMTLVTSNLKHFERIEGLNIENWK